jgi:inward rectifier potassium channel
MDERANDTDAAAGDAGMTVRRDAFTLKARGALKYDWRDPYHLALTLNWPHFIAAFFIANITINLIFAGLYLLQPGSVANVAPGSLSEAFFFSLQTLATVGYGVMAPQTFYGHIVASTEIFCGMAFTAIMTGLVFVRFSRPRARIAYAENVVVSTFNGKPTLMIRIANGRVHPLTEATATVSALIDEWSTEGQFFRRTYDLKLVRNRIPIFGLVWTLMHEIDEESPLNGCSVDSLDKKISRLFLSVQARDPMLAAHVYDTHDYDPENVLFGRRYCDALTIDGKGNTVADLARINWTQPDNDPIAESVASPARM